jgi:hypothetical protein
MNPQRQETAALRDFDPAYDRSGSIASDQHSQWFSRMSAVPPIASEFRGFFQGPLLLVVFGSAISQCRAALFDQRLKLTSHFVARSVLSPEILLQAVHVIDAGTDLRERTCVA